ncbi:uncharacterized protein F4812DRAFT_466267 [Daldinia caldariorum]|uniref:uncharacterized protein n=1 Tax=Daldinia caldariorum TaxID=326644 RepID=UPI0020075A0C|nr:uncharacterized protein F4812DRAFT_466267 [Daldinia caldariorum]KAI1465846.1 hypothetical protein F4812DRAFT_466267 [Daldinia caldariorum]
MKAVASLLTFPLVTIVAAIAPRAEPPAGPWTAGVWKIAEGTDVFFWGTPINASGGKFWINKAASTECPGDIENLDCSEYPGTETIFDGGNGTVFLDVGVPGGQQVYIAENGALSYTIPHSGQIPDGSVATGFSRQVSNAFGAPVLLYHASGTWYICPVGEGEPKEKVYQLYVGKTDMEGCYWASVRTYQPGGGNAWEYV